MMVSTKGVSPFQGTLFSGYMLNFGGVFGMTSYTVNILLSYMGIIINNYYKDPYWNNQDSMESERFFFFVAHSVI